MISRPALVKVVGVIVLSVIGILVLSQPIQASTVINVSTTIDNFTHNGDCTLREAIRAANTDTAVDACPAGSGADVIVIPAGVFTLTIAGSGEEEAATGDLDLTGTLTLLGSGAVSTIVDGGGFAVQDRVFDVKTNSKVTISGVTIQNGHAPFGSGGAGLGIDSGATVTVTDSIIRNNQTSSPGGGISNGGQLTLIRSSIEGNLTSNGGGGIANGGILLLIDSTVTGNRTMNCCGGGIRTFSNGTLTLTNTSIISNTAPGGGGISGYGNVSIVASLVASNTATTFGGGGISMEGVSLLTLIDSTVSGNQTANSGGGIATSNPLVLRSTTIVSNTAADGGGLAVSSVTMMNTLISGNMAGAAPDCSGQINSLGYNLIQNVAGCIIGGTSTGNVTGTVALIGQLQNNGGRTMTHALLAGSPAIDAGDPSGCRDDQGNPLTTDQRGYSRNLDGDGDSFVRCDIGAYELFVPSHWVYLPIISR